MKDKLCKITFICQFRLCIKRGWDYRSWFVYIFSSIRLLFEIKITYSLQPRVNFWPPLLTPSYYCLFVRALSHVKWANLESMVSLEGTQWIRAAKDPSWLPFYVVGFLNLEILTLTSWIFEYYLFISSQFLTLPLNFFRLLHA